MQNEGALIYHGVRGLYFLVVIFATTIDVIGELHICKNRIVDYIISLNFLHTVTQWNTNYTSHKNNCRAWLSYSARAIFSVIYFWGDYNKYRRGTIRCPTIWSRVGSWDLYLKSVRLMLLYMSAANYTKGLRCIGCWMTFSRCRSLWRNSSRKADLSSGFQRKAFVAENIVTTPLRHKESFK